MRQFINVPVELILLQQMVNAFSALQGSIAKLLMLILLTVKMVTIQLEVWSPANDALLGTDA